VGALRTKLDVLRRHCEHAHRDYAEIEKTVLDTVHLAPGQTTAADVISHCRSLATIGIQHVIFNMPNVHELAPLGELSREVIPAVAEW
jgi:alkanesulfonate monooxygenase